MSGQTGRSRRGCGRRDRGAAAVEMAIILPLLLLLIGGMVDLGRAFHYQIMLANAAREGARLASLDLDSSVVLRSQQAAGPLMPTALVTWDPNACPAGPTDSVTVKVANSFSWTMLGAIPGLPQPGSPPGTLFSEATMRCA